MFWINLDDRTLLALRVSEIAIRTRIGCPQVMWTQVIIDIKEGGKLHDRHGNLITNIIVLQVTLSGTIQYRRADSMFARGMRTSECSVFVTLHKVVGVEFNAQLVTVCDISPDDLYQDAHKPAHYSCSKDGYYAPCPDGYISYLET